MYKLAAPRSHHYLAPVSQYNTRLLRQKAVGACLYMPQGGHWLASCEVIPPPQSLFFRGQKIADSPLKTAVSDLKCWRFLFFGKRIVTPFSTIANINRLPPESRLIRPRPMDCDPRWEKCFLVFFFRPQNTCFLVFFGQPVFFSAVGAFFFRGVRFIINITITLTKLLVKV